MRYLSESHVDSIALNWNDIFNVIEDSCLALRNKDFSQPIKPYLRYRDLTNRIIAMPAFLGGQTDTAGIKWIASFPDNINNGIQRAHSTVVLNEAHTGKPFAIINSGKLSAIRTSAVSGAVARKWLEKNPGKKVWGMTGYGPIGQTHMQMMAETFADSIDHIYLYDLREVDKSKFPAALADKITVTDSWQSAFEKSDVFMTCTVSKDRYIDATPRPNSLHLNVSLRDYKPEFINHVDVMVVDDWDEVCRENTDIEAMAKDHGLKREDTLTMHDFISSEMDLNDKITMFNPMGMAIFDIAVGRYYFELSQRLGVGVQLEN